MVAQQIQYVVEKRARKQTMMPPGTVGYLRRLLERWGGACIVCGRGFTTLASVTREHCVPRQLSKRAKKQFHDPDNVAPSHHRCNSLRKSHSLLRSARRIEHVRLQIGNEERFMAWLNVPVPHRSVPNEALQHFPGQEPAPAAASTSAGINDAQNLRPGTLLRFSSHKHVGLGFVVAQMEHAVLVLWDDGCFDRLRAYDVARLNGKVLSRLT